MYFPGHYMRRIRSVSVTIPCIAGPYTTINATLRLLENKFRLNAISGGGYPERMDEADSRFTTLRIPVGSIATSNSQNDPGVFELNFKDERFMPFEGAGVISKWNVKMMKEEALRQFDYNTISDLILHIRYTSKEDSNLKTAAVSHLKTLTTSLGETAFARMFSLRHDFPNQWHIWKQGGAMNLDISKERHFPYWVQGRTITINEINLYKHDTTDNWYQNPVQVMAYSLPMASGSLSVTDVLPADRSAISDVFLLLNYRLNELR